MTARGVENAPRHQPIGRVLLINPTYKPQWKPPGAPSSMTNPPRTAATREIAEELGLHTTGRLLALGLCAHRPRPRPRPRPHRGHGRVFDGGTIADPTILRLPPDELSDHAFVEPAQPPLPTALQARRAIAALQSSATEHAAYLENGHQPS